MATFVTEDGKGGISGDKFMIQHGLSDVYSSNSIPYVQQRKHHTDVDKLKKPAGKTNGHRINNINDCDLLTHIQQTLSLTGRCILEMITNEDHSCIKMNDTIGRKIRLFAEDKITESFREAHPRGKIRYKISENEFDYRDETDEEWNDRLYHMYMHQNHPSKLQMIKCEECLQQWMNSDKW